MTTIFTIGHSNREIDDFLALLTQHEITVLADVRTIPKSRHNPQFWHDALAESLDGVGIRYVAIPELGGRRRTHKDSINTAWRNASFRGYADHMQSDEFHKGLDTLMSLADDETVAIMCAEAVPWRCHRSLVGDALLIRGYDVHDIISPTSVRPHTLTGWAKVNGLTITYPGDADGDQSSSSSSSS